MPGCAWAYIGPGAGLSAIGVLVALVGGVLLVIIGFVWYPAKKLYRKLSSSRNTTTERKRKQCSSNREGKEGEQT